jgi:phosphate transport system substrate-binding protein
MSNHQKVPVLLALLLGAALLFGTPWHPALASDTLRIGGNGSGLGAMKELARAYGKTHPAVTIVILPSLGSSGGIAALKNGALDLTISARPLKADEVKAGLVAIPYARSPFLFAAHGKVPATDLTMYRLLEIYRQEASRWPDGTRVRLVLRPSQDVDTALIKAISPEVERALRDAMERPGMVVAVTDHDSLDAIASMPGSLGGATLTEILTEGRSVRALSYNGVAPSLKNLAAGSYPLVKTYYLVAGEHPSAQARDFAAFVRSPKARQVLRRWGNLPTFDGKER